MKKHVKLLKPHTHAGCEYPASARIELDADSANWLIGLGVAEEVTNGTDNHDEEID